MSVAKFELDFSYGQFIVWDSLVLRPGLAWTETHSRQGFARREDVVAFATLLEFGKAVVRVLIEPFTPSAAYERVVGVSFFARSGIILIEAPDEIDPGRRVSVKPGQYWVVCAQREVESLAEDVVLFFDGPCDGVASSRILVADEALEPPSVLLETAEIACVG